jgi:phosphatidylserine synthase
MLPGLMSTPDQMPDAAETRIASKPIIAYLIDAANITTLAGLLSSLSAITFAVRGEFSAAGIGLILAFFFDGIDGPVAKRISGRTDDDRAFGANLDSLVDMVGAGVTLAVVLLAYGEFGLGWVPGALALAAAAALRLSYFNVFGLAPGTKSYVGLPTDQAIVAIAAIMLLDGPLEREPFQFVIYAAGIAVAALMVSPLRIPKVGGAFFYVFNGIAFAIAAGHAARLIF